MFNRPFDAGEEAMPFLFAQLTVKNIDFALISLHHLLDLPPNRRRYRDDVTYYFFHLQSLLTACGQIYNVFYGRGIPRRGYGMYERAKRMREMFQVDKYRYPLVFLKAARNTSEHFDERMDLAGWDVGDCNVIDRDTPPEMRDAIRNSYHLRTFYRETGCYETYGYIHRQWGPIQLDCHQLREQLMQMRETIVRHPEFDGRWTDGVPGEVLV